MITVVLIIHLLIALSLVGSILLQKSEGGALGMGGGGMSGFMTGRSTANLLTRTTATLAVLFFLTSISLAWLAARQRAPHSIIDLPSQSAPALPSKLSPVPAPANAPITGGSVPSSSVPLRMEEHYIPPGGKAPAAPSAPAPAAPAKPAAPAEPSAPLAK